MGRLSESFALVRELQGIMDSSGSDNLRAFLYDAHRFILHSYTAIDETPLQLYSSALLFAPEQSIVRQCFEKDTSWVAYKPMTGKTWQPCLQTLDHHAEVRSVSVSGDSNLIASGASDGIVRVWDTTTGVLQHRLEGHEGEVCSVAFSDDGKTIASGSRDGTMKIWDAETGLLHYTCSNLSTMERDREINSVDFSRNGRIASGHGNGAITIWDASTGKRERKFYCHHSEITSLAFSRDGSLLASGSWDHTIKVWDAATGQLQHTLEGHTGDVSSVAFSSHDELLASVFWNGKIKIWDTETWELRDTLQHHTAGTLSSVAFSKQGQRLASASYDQIKIWDVANQTVLRTLEGHGRDVNAVAFHGSSKFLISASNDHTVKIWDLTQPNTQDAPESHSTPTMFVCFSYDNTMIASASRGTTVKIFDAMQGELKYTLEGHSYSVFSVAFSPNSELIASGCGGHTVKVWDTKDGMLRQTSDVEGPIERISFSSTGSHLIIDPGHVVIKVNVGLRGTEDQSAAHFDENTEDRTGDLLEPSFTSQHAGSAQDRYCGLSLNQEWVTWNGQEVIWLPPDYRPNTRDAPNTREKNTSAISPSRGMIAIGSASGGFFRLGGFDVEAT